MPIDTQGHTAVLGSAAHNRSIEGKYGTGGFRIAA
jgi:hypothetical protein